MRDQGSHFLEWHSLPLVSGLYATVNGSENLLIFIGSEGNRLVQVENYVSHDFTIAEVVT
ncbi:MAG: hypothetical protein IT165_13715 [Bryobacterales bacterium]|nr:hypothetical protein [Bryobacterales bacterium]